MYDIFVLFGWPAVSLFFSSAAGRREFSFMPRSFLTRSIAFLLAQCYSGARFMVPLHPSKSIAKLNL